MTSHNPNLFDEIVSPGLTMRLRALDYAMKMVSYKPEDGVSTSSRDAATRAHAVITAAKQIEAYLKQDS